MGHKEETTTNRQDRVKRSLNTKTFLITLMLTMGIGITVLIAGFVLYFMGVVHEYFVNTWHLSNSQAALLEQTEYKEICDNILDIYDGIPEYAKGDGTSQEYIALFDKVETDTFYSIKDSMNALKERNEQLNAFVVALDPAHEKMIYLIDSDPGEETFCRPGTWDIYPQDQLESLINGSKPFAIDKQKGLDKGVQAIITNRPEFGLRCTAAATLYEKGPYTIVVCVDEKLAPVVDTSKFFLAQFVVLLLAITLLASFIGMRLMRKAMINPINKMAEAADEYKLDEDKESGTKYFADLNISTGDEIEQLAVALKDMEGEIGNYMEDLTKATAEKERIATELSLAAGIQKSMLNEIFPPFPDRNEFDVYASMEPAKQIGGDFYDMILIDDDHLAIEIADVSGKGIPAALFMMSAKIMLADSLRETLSPAKVLEDVNNKISANNQEEMFVTVWLGILKISTGKLTCANAGHEYPIVVHEDGKVELIKDKHGFVIGGMEGMKYTEYDILLEKGDRIFVYTDGVTEATSADTELYGMDRVVDALAAAKKDATPAELLSAVRGSIEKFTEGAEQFDDLTMLSMEYKGEQK